MDSLPPKSNLKGILFALLAFGIFATHDVVVKILGAYYAPFQVVFFSVLFGFPLVTIMLLRDQTGDNLRPKHPWWTGLRTFAAVCTGSSAFYAFKTLPLAETYAILFAMPLLITVLSVPILGEKVGWRRGLAVIVGLLGVIVVLQPGQSTLGLGHLAAMVAAMGGSLASIIIRKIGNDERSVVLLLYPMVGNFIVMGALMPLVYIPMPIEHIGLLAIVALFGFVAMLCMISAYRNGEAAMVAPMQYSQILWATGFGFIFFNERPDWNVAIGATIIIASGLYIVMREAARKSSKRPVLDTMQQRQETGIHPRIGLMSRFRGESNAHKNVDR